MVEIIGYVLCYLVFAPFKFVCQAVAGILAASQSRLQFRLKATAISALVAGASAMMAAWFVPLGKGWALFALAFLLLSAAGSIGYRLQRHAFECREKNGT